MKTIFTAASVLLIGASSSLARQGHTHPAGHKPAAHTARAAAPLKLTAALVSPKMGENKLMVTVLNVHGSPVTHAKLAATVAMTSMDMGTSHPTAKELGKGHYLVPVKFAMKGPWRVSLAASAPGYKPMNVSFVYQAR